MKKKFLILIVALLGLTIIFYAPTMNKKASPVTMGINASLRKLTLDEKIKEADLIIIGKIMTILPVKWSSPSGKKINEATPEEIFQAGGLFTDSVISVEQILKGDNKDSIVRTRSFFGETDLIRWVNSNEPNYKKDTTYLFFLEKDYGSTQMIDAGYYISVNSNTAVYEITNNKAISADDKWVLDDLINYIQNSPFVAPSNIPDTPELKAIMQTVENAYDVEAKASYSFDLSKFSSVFVNESRYRLNLDALEFVKTFVGNPSLEVSGYLDYKIAYYNWWKEGLSRYNDIREKAIAENRNMTKDELNAFLASKWGKIPGRIKDPGRRFKIRFVSINIDKDIATVIFNAGQKTFDLYLVLINGQWYIAGNKEISILTASTVTETPLPVSTATDIAVTETPLPTDLPTKTPLPALAP